MDPRERFESIENSLNEVNAGIHGGKSVDELRNIISEKERLENERNELLSEAYDEAHTVNRAVERENTLPETYPGPTVHETYSREGYDETLQYLENLEQELNDPAKDDNDLLFLLRRRIEAREELDRLDRLARVEAVSEHRHFDLAKTKDSLTGEYLKDLDLLQELFERHFKNGFGAAGVGTYRSRLPGIKTITISYEGDRVLVNPNGDPRKTILVYQNGKIEGKIPKDFGFGKVELLEEILTIVDTTRDAFYLESPTQEIDLEDDSDFVVEGEVVPPEELEPFEWKGGEMKGPPKPPPDPRRLQFYKELPGVCMTFEGTINTRRTIERYGVKGIPYRGYVFPDYVILDCEEVGNAIFVRRLDEPLVIPKERLDLPVTQRMSLEEKQAFERNIWEHFRGQGKAALREMGFRKMRHPDAHEDEPDYFRSYFNRLAREIDFSQYGKVPVHYVE